MPIPDSRFLYGMDGSNLRQIDEDLNLVSEVDLGDNYSQIKMDSDKNLFARSDYGIISHTPEGDVRWEVELDDHKAEISVDDGGNVFVADYLGQVEKYDAKTGNQDWKSGTRLNSSWDGTVPDGEGGLYVLAAGDAYHDKKVARVRSGGFVSANILDTSGDMSQPVLDPQTGGVTFFDSGVLRKFDSALSEVNTDSSVSQINWRVDPKVGQDGSIYFATKTDNSFGLLKYNWGSGVVWETEVTETQRITGIDQLSITPSGDLYVSYGFPYEFGRYNADTGVRTDQWGSPTLRTFLIYPDYPQCSDAWGDETRVSTPGKGITGETTTPTPGGSGFSSVSGGGATATASSTTGTASAGLTPDVETTVSAPTPTMPSSVSRTAPSVEGDTISSTTTSVPTPTVGVDMTAAPVAGGTATTEPVKHATATSGVTRTTGATTPQLPSGTVLVSMEATSTTHNTPVYTPSVVSQAAPTVASNAAQTTSQPIVGALKGVSAGTTSLAVQSTMYGAETLLDAVRATKLAVLTTTGAPTTDTTTSSTALLTGATGETATPLAEAIAGVYGSGATVAPTLDPASGLSGATVHGSLVSTPVALSTPQTASGVELLAVPVREATASLSPSVGSLGVSQASHVDSTVSTVVPDGTTSAAVVSQLYSALATPLVPFGYDPRLAGPTSGSNRLQGQDSSNSASLRSSRNQSDVVGGSNSSTLNVSTNEIDVEVTE
ncbi:hypothetical protein [Halorubrum sp. AJ67]|uniref:hypothetical protein n=1 Tax=Halorubrum sp. AJ67 TaxID=1173487 RepID=UPI001896A43A|nr:hypothetical protein [Halorubrum sp. AJ67]